MKLRQYIKMVLQESFEEPIYNHDINEPKWEPLYLFLKHIFGDTDYIRAADSFMFYGSYDCSHISKDLILYQYRQGITRKMMMLDKTGQPYFNNINTCPKKATHEEIFKHIYQNLNAYLCAGGECDPKYVKEPWFVKYTEWTSTRDGNLKKAGYNTLSINQDNIDDLKNI